MGCWMCFMGICWRRFGFGSVLKIADKLHERFDIAFDTGFFEGIHVLISFFDGNDDPVVAAGGKHGVHQEAAEAAVAVHVWVDKGEEEVAKDGSDGCFWLSFQQFKIGGHGVC